MVNEDSNEFELEFTEDQFDKLNSIIKNMGGDLTPFIEENLNEAPTQFDFQKSELTDLEKYNLKTASMEIGLYVGIGLLIKALAAGTDDDDKKEEWYKFAMLVGHRTTSELGFFMDPEATGQILLHPAASISLIDDYSRLVKNLWKESNGDAKERKAAKPLKSLGKVIPWVGQWQRFVDELFNINLSSD